MDFLAHGFWSFIFFYKIKKPVYAILFGLLPDTFSWVIYLIYRLITWQVTFGNSHLNSLPDWVFTLYGLSHSLVICGLVFFVVYLVLKKIPIFMLAWPLAILMDIPTHTREFLPTPFLWPVSAWKFPGISWGSKWFMILNWSLILLGLGYILASKKGWLRKFKKN